MRPAFSILLRGGPNPGREARDKLGIAYGAAALGCLAALVAIGYPMWFLAIQGLPVLAAFGGTPPSRAPIPNPYLKPEP